MRYIATAFLFVFPLLCVARTLLQPVFVGEPLILSLKEAPKLFKQCSRTAPVPTKILAPPLPVEIEELEIVLSRHIAIEYEAGRESPLEDMPYSRQYVAFLEGGNRKIYGNYFPSGAVSNRWAGGAFTSCSGGKKFWGAVFVSDTKKIERIEFNGPQ